MMESNNMIDMKKYFMELLNNKSEYFTNLKQTWQNGK